MHVYALSAVMIFPIVVVALLLATEWWKRHVGKR
jgi:hypothetical protein